MGPQDTDTVINATISVNTLVTSPSAASGTVTPAARVGRQVSFFLFYR